MTTNSLKSMLLIVATFALACASILGCSGNGDSQRASGSVAAQTFPTWDAYLEQRGDASERRKVVFIGLDGATWELMDPMIEDGKLPNFARLKKEGAWGILRSTETYVSPPAWTTLMSGFLPEHTGIYSFGHWDADNEKFLPVRSTDVLAPRVWDVTSLAGARTAAINVPVTFPPRDINGIMVSGLMSPTRVADRRALEVIFGSAANPGAIKAESFSPILQANFVEHGNHIDLHLYDSSDDGETNYNRVHMRITNVAAGEQVYRFEVSKFTDWIRLDVEKPNGPNDGWARLALVPSGQPHRWYLRFSHTLWASSTTDVVFTSPTTLVDDIHKAFDHYFPSTYLDAELVPGHAREAAQYASFFFDYDDWDLYAFVFTQTDNALHAAGMSPTTERVFEIIDDFLGELIDALPDNHTLVLGSDHGFAEYDKAVDMNRLFEALGILKYKKAREIDYGRTLAFHNMWAIHYNHALLTREELQGRGIECGADEDPHAALTRFIRSEPKRYLSEELGHDVPLEFSDVPDDAVGAAPDLFLTGSYSKYQLELWNLRKPRPDIITPLTAGARWYHTRRGMFLIKGPDIQPGEVPATDIQNIAPTLLYLLGLPAPVNIDGEVITSVFQPEALAAKPRYIVADYAALPKELDLSDEKRNDIEKQLRSLGYIR